jgi:DnaJ-class molecular chaperone
MNIKNILIVSALSIFVPYLLNATDAYSLLHITRSATPEDIKKVCRTKALELHPDKHPQATEQEKKEFETQFIETRKACDELLKTKTTTENGSTATPEKDKQTKLHRAWQTVTKFFKKLFNKKN